MVDLPAPLSPIIRAFSGLFNVISVKVLPVLKKLHHRIVLKMSMALLHHMNFVDNASVCIFFIYSIILSLLTGNVKPDI